MLCAEYTGAERVAVIKKKIANICEDNKGQYMVQRMPVFDENAEYVDFAAQFNPRRIPLGFAKNTGKSVALPLKQFIGLGIYFGNSQGTKPILNNLLYSFQRENMEMWIIKSKKDSLFDVNNPDGIDVSCMKNADFLDCEQDNLRTLQQAMVGVVDLRTKNAKSSEDVDNKNEVPEIMLLIENGEDFSSELNPVSYLSFRRLFENAHKYGIYVLCCFQPQNLMNISKRSLQSIFMSGDVLLFGGQYDKQKLYNFGSVAGIDAELWHIFYLQNDFFYSTPFRRFTQSLKKTQGYCRKHGHSSNLKHLCVFFDCTFLDKSSLTFTIKPRRIPHSFVMKFSGVCTIHFSAVIKSHQSRRSQSF